MESEEKLKTSCGEEMVLFVFKTPGRRAPATILAAIIACMCVFLATPAMALGWVTSPEQAKAMLASNEKEAYAVTILDVRGKKAFREAHVKGAQRVTWQEFSRASGSDHGELLEKDGVLGHRLRKVGVSNEVPVLVVGDPLDGWGEEGRIVWMLRTLGHTQAALVDGGHEALVELGVELEKGATKKVPAGDFEIDRTDAFSVTQAEVKAMLDAKDAVFLDTREAREFAGETPYGEARGGHLPGAHHLYFSDLLDEKGKILAPDALQSKLEAMGITGKSRPIVAYCTGGIRSAWVVAILQDAGYIKARNYAGSMWQWSAGEAATYPLEGGTKKKEEQ